MEIQPLVAVVTKKYNLIYQESFVPDKPIYCQVCSQVVSGSAYIGKQGEEDTLGMHKSCAESPGEIRHHPLHPYHHLKAVFEVVDGWFMCDGCKHLGIGISYRCHDCKFTLDFKCVSNPEMQQLPKVEEISTPFHPQHKLQLLFCTKPNSNNRINVISCCCCSEHFQISAYTCFDCDLFIHERCIEKVPLNVISPFHPEPPLLLETPNLFETCEMCANSVWGLKLACKACRCNFHISCCTNTVSFLKLNCHKDHSMVYLNKPHQCFLEKIKKCVVCNTNSDRGIYCCFDCKVYVHIECIPLPSVVKNVYHPYHPLPLKLSDPIHEKNVGDKCYHCVICEEKGYLKYPFYFCEECSDMAHVDCVLSQEEPPSEILEYLVPKSRQEEEEGSDKDDDYNKTKQDTTEGKTDVLQVRTDLEDCSLRDIDERISNVQNKIEELVLELGVLREVSASKLNRVGKTE